MGNVEPVAFVILLGLFLLVFWLAIAIDFARVVEAGFFSFLEAKSLKFIKTIYINGMKKKKKKEE